MTLALSAFQIVATVAAVVLGLPAAALLGWVVGDWRRERWRG